MQGYFLQGDTSFCSNEMTDCAMVTTLESFIDKLSGGD